MKHLAFALALSVLSIYAIAQTHNANHKFSPQQLRTDLTFVEKQLFNAHADPFTELSKSAYEKLFNDLSARLTDSMSATTFYKCIKPVVAPLSDEHAGLSISADLQTDSFKSSNTFLPFSLVKKGKFFIVDELLLNGTDLKKGIVITAINNQPIASCITKCANYTTGFPSQRAQHALEQFGYLYTLSQPGTYYSFSVKSINGRTIIIKGIGLKVWQDYLIAKAGSNNNDDHRITYTRYGNAAYVNVPEFIARNDNEMDSLKKQVAQMFRQIKADGVSSLFIDVSKNDGGNSAVGDVLIDHFYSKPYRDYQCNWKRSDEYLALLKSWKIKPDDYEKEPIGKVIHYDSYVNHPSQNDPDRFGGKVYVVVGNGTFSSAIMFATIVKDNNLATLVGQIPADGHPNHFGELYNTKLPNTRLDLRFGVKEWIRPAGKTGENVLRPDIVVNPDTSPEVMIKAVLNKVN